MLRSGEEAHEALIGVDPRKLGGGSALAASALARFPSAEPSGPSIVDILLHIFISGFDRCVYRFIIAIISLSTVLNYLGAAIPKSSGI